MSTDQFTAALELTHNFNPNATPCHRREAEQYLMSLRSSPDGLALSLHILAEEPVNEIRCFWALNTINDHLPNLTSAEGLALSVMGAQNGSVDTVASIYHTLLTFLHAYLFSATATPVEFLLNKHAQTVALGMQAFYPTQWQSLFDDLFNLLERGRAMQTGGDAATAYVLRVFQSIDECIVNVPDRGARDKQQRARSMELKDSMRERTIPRVVDLWYRVLSDCCERVPEISKLCLTVAQSYITWIDVNLMITPEWIQLLYFLVSNVAILRTAAYECLLSLVQKKQLPGTKYISLAALNVVDTLPRIVQAQLSAGTSVNGTWSLVVGSSTASLGASSPCTSALGEDETSAAIDVLSKLVVAVAEQLMTLVEACSQATSASDVAIYLQRGGLDATGALISEEPLPVSAEMAAELLRSLHTVVRQLLFIWCEADTTEVLESVLPFVQAYVKSPMLVEEEASVILTTAFEHSRLDRRYTSSLKASGMDMSTTASLTHFSAAVLWDDFIVDQRKQLYNLIRLLHRRSPDFVLQHLEKVIQEHLLSPRIEELITTSQSLPELMAALSHLEASLRYLYEMGECVKLDSCLRDAEDAYARLVGAVLMNNTSLHTAMLRGTGGATHDACTGASSLVALAYFEVMDRCYLFFQNFPNTIPNLLDRLLLQPYGVMHVEDKVRSRVCCLFGHLLQVLRSVLQPYASDMVMALQSIASTATQLQPQNRRDVYEAIGVLLRIAISSAVASHSLTSAPSGAGNQEVAKTSSIANNDTLGEDAQRVITQLVQPVLSSAVDTLQQLEGGAALNPSDAERVAEVVSYLSALVRGMGEVADFSGSSDDCSRGRGWPPVCEGLSQLLESTSAAVLRAVSAWSFSAAVREASGNYFQQALNALPLSRLASFLEPYVCGMLQRIEVVPELSRLIRLLTQVVNKDGVESLRMVAQLLPPVWEKVEQVGDLAGSSASSPVVQMGVVSESAKEKMEVYRQIFTLVFSISTWGCAESMLMMPPDMVQAFLVQAHHAIAHLPCEVELPKSAMQCVVKLYAALTTANRQRTGRALDSTAANSLSVNESKLPLAEVTAEMLHHYTQITTTIVNALLPAALQRILTADFDLKDARNYLLVGEICQLCLLAAAEGALELIFHQLQPSVGEAEAQSFCVALGTLVSANTVKLPTSMKLQFRNMVSSGSGHRIAQ